MAVLGTLPSASSMVAEFFRYVSIFVVFSQMWHCNGDDDANEFEEHDMDEDTLSEHQLRRLHKQMDADGDGQLSFKESLEYAKAVTKSIARKDVKKIIEEIDKSKDGLISLEEHMADIQDLAQGGDEEEMNELPHRMEIEKAKFLAADENQDQHLQAHEVASLFYPETHDGVLSVKTRETLRQKDKDGDGRMSPMEFWEVDESDGEDGQLSAEEISDFENLDTNKDGFLTVEEVQFWEGGDFHTHSAMKKMFEVADTDSDMHLSADELAHASDELSLSDAQYHLIEWAEHHEL
eukprot:TRINITY_DN1122_c0_g3_i1.p1 TRINITY_DN1122_c0_g3~~TRINITY_DN1122_c0_g3_i1.p1  ORF type:complete len:293 (+),score=78.65 TRINITY_DN1122_c0_g3_i1:29-907(+)